MESASLHKILAVAKEAASAAGAHIALSWSKRDVAVSYKGITNLVTQYDLESEKIIVDIIKKQFPDHEFLTEESHTTVKNREDYLKPLWIIDPIDGTTNFAHGHYQVAVSIGFAIEGVMTVGVVHNPFLKETYWSIKGEGAFRNDTKIFCNPDPELKHALIATGFPYEKDGIDTLMARAKAVLLNCRELRRLGSGALDICWVADGRLNGYYETLSPWDCAAAMVIAREAGVICGHIHSIPEDFNLPADFYTTGLLFANPELFPKLQKILA